MHVHQHQGYGRCLEKNQRLQKVGQHTRIEAAISESREGREAKSDFSMVKRMAVAAPVVASTLNCVSLSSSLNWSACLSICDNYDEGLNIPAIEHAHCMFEKRLGIASAYHRGLSLPRG